MKVNILSENVEEETENQKCLTIKKNMCDELYQQIKMQSLIIDVLRKVIGCS